MKPENKRIIITGAANGLGKALLEELAPVAKIIVAIDRDKSGLDAISKKYGRKVKTIACNLVNSLELKMVTKSIIKNNHKYDLLINCAGIGSHKSLAQYSHEEIKTIVYLNCVVPFSITSSMLAAKLFMQGAVVVNIGSVSGEVPLPFMPLYSASKAFLHSFTKSSMAELKMKDLKFLLVILGSLSDTKFGENLTVKKRPSTLSYFNFRKSSFEAARKIIQAIKKDRRMLIFPGYLTHLIRMERFFPGFTLWFKSYLFHKYYRED